MVEAAIFFPITIFAVMAVLALLINLYSQTSLQAHIHMEVRAEAASAGDRMSARINDAYVRDRYRSEAESVSVELREGSRGGMDTIEAERSKKYFGGRLTDPRGYEREFFGSWYVIDEAGSLRRIGIIR